MLFLLQFRFCFVLVECFGWQYLPAQNLLPWECWYFLSAFAFLRKWKFWGWLECTVRYRVSSTQTVVASTSWRPCYETNFLTCFINKLVQNKSLPLDFGFVRARGAGSPWAYWRAPPKSPTNCSPVHSVLIEMAFHSNAICAIKYKSICYTGRHA